MTRYIGYRDGGKTNEEGLMKFLARVFTPGTPRTDTPTSLRVVQKSGGANMSVDVSVGDTHLVNPAGTYSYWGWTDAVENLSLDAADPSNPRIDTIVGYVDLSVVDSTSNNNPGALKFTFVKGTAAGSPVAANDAAIQSQLGANTPWTKLATVLVGTGVTTILNANITDARADISLKVATSSTITSGYNALLYTPSSVVYNGNRCSTITFAGVDLTSVLSSGMKARFTRTTAAPTQCTSLNGSTQYWARTATINGMTSTDDQVAGSWVKMTQYGATSVVASRFNGTSGYSLEISSAGQVVLIGYNASANNYSLVQSYQSIPVNKWVHIAAQLDMSAFTATSTTSYVMIDGMDVPATVSRGGTNPTALVQAGNLEIGSKSGGTNLFPGKIVQTFITSAKVTQTNTRTIYSQGITASDITALNIVSAYSFSNSINDLNTTNANNLAAGAGSPNTTNADSPFGTQANGSISSTVDFGIMNKVALVGSDTVINVQAAEGCTIPTSGSVSTVTYSTHETPYGFPTQKEKWRISSIINSTQAVTSNANYGSFMNGGWALGLPIGNWDIGWQGQVYSTTTTAVYFNMAPSPLTGLTASQGNAISPYTHIAISPTGTMTTSARKVFPRTVDVLTNYVMYTAGSTTGAGLDANTFHEIFAENTYV